MHAISSENVDRQTEKMTERQKIGDWWLVLFLYIFSTWKGIENAVVPCRTIVIIIIIFF